MNLFCLLSSQMQYKGQWEKEPLFKASAVFPPGMLQYQPAQPLKPLTYQKLCKMVSLCPFLLHHHLHHLSTLLHFALNSICYCFSHSLILAPSLSLLELTFILHQKLTSSSASIHNQPRHLLRSHTWSVSLINTQRESFCCWKGLFLHRWNYEKPLRIERKKEKRRRELHDEYALKFVLMRLSSYPSSSSSTKCCCSLLAFGLLMTFDHFRGLLERWRQMR